VQVGAYLPPGLVERIEQLARAEHRSTSNMITILLATAVIDAKARRRPRSRTA
jgi:hypothetical protein